MHELAKKLRFEGDLHDCKVRTNYGISKILPVYLNVHTTSVLDNPNTTNSEFSLSQINSFYNSSSKVFALFF